MQISLCHICPEDIYEMLVKIRRYFSKDPMCTVRRNRVTQPWIRISWLVKKKLNNLFPMKNWTVEGVLALSSPRSLNFQKRKTIWKFKFFNDVNVGFNKERRNLRRYRFIPQFMRFSIHGIPGCLSCNFSFTQNFISSRPFVLCIISWKRGLDRSLLRFLRFPRQSPSSSLLNYIHTE